MPESKHTSGPWKHGELDDTTVYIWAYPDKGDDYGCLIAEVKSDDLSSAKEHAANVRLIAAAPDLLAALETLLNATNDIKDLDGCPERFLAKVAITRARGK